MRTPLVSASTKNMKEPCCPENAPLEWWQVRVSVGGFIRISYLQLVLKDIWIRYCNPLFPSCAEA